MEFGASAPSVRSGARSFSAPAGSLGRALLFRPGWLARPRAIRVWPARFPAALAPGPRPHRSGSRPYPPLRLRQGCANAVRRVLGKLDGVQSVEIDLPQQKVTVESTSEPEVVKAQVAKSGKKTELWT